MMLRTGMLMLFSVSLIVTFSHSSKAAETLARDFQERPLTRIPAGTEITTESTEGWSDLLLFVKGSLGSGDVSSASSTCHHYASLFNLVYMANVEKDEQNRFRLDKIGVGFSTKINGRNVIITSDTYKKLGADLGLFGGTVFSANEKALNDIVQVARYRDGAIFDAPTIMLRDRQHKKVVVRFFVWVSPQGKVGTVCWVLDGFSTGQYRGTDRQVKLLQPKLVENRVMHVDGDQFTFGIPSEDAFAVVSLPPGRSFPIDDELNALLAVRRYDAATFFEAIQKLSQSLTAR